MWDKYTSRFPPSWGWGASWFPLPRSATPMTMMGLGLLTIVGSCSRRQQRHGWWVTFKHDIDCNSDNCCWFLVSRLVWVFSGFWYFILKTSYYLLFPKIYTIIYYTYPKLFYFPPYPYNLHSILSRPIVLLGSNWTLRTSVERFFLPLCFQIFA